ncbi:MAG: asparagine synthetase B, partial [Calditrichia bacterium]
AMMEQVKRYRTYDKEVLAGKLSEYDWLHLHHEDFTGQFGKFYGAYRNAPWYQEEVRVNEAIASQLGYPNVPALKGAVAREIKRYVDDGGFLFAMCSGTDALDIALAAEGVDIVDLPYDGDPPDANYQQRLDFTKTLAFQNFRLYTDPNRYEFSDIDIPPSFAPRIRDPESDYFSLFEFSAKYDPVPTMLTQNHVSIVKGFMGQTTMFNRKKIKPSVIIMGEVEGTNEVRYIHGNSGKGTFTFYGGHDPEDYTHAVGDPPTQLELHKNSPGYRLILNNILFPAARKKKLKT